MAPTGYAKANYVIPMTYDIIIDLALSSHTSIGGYYVYQEYLYNIWLQHNVQCMTIAVD